MAYYIDQHMAWQQRVTKELSAANRFLNEYSPLPRPATKSSTFSQASIKDSFYLNRGDLRHVNVFAEVRGKYARPALIINKKPENSQLTVKDHPFLVRPTTSGSLKPRNALSTAPSHKKTQSLIEEIPEEPQIQEKNKKNSERLPKIKEKDSKLEENLTKPEKKHSNLKKATKELNISTTTSEIPASSNEHRPHPQQPEPETASDSLILSELDSLALNPVQDTDSSEIQDEVAELEDHQSKKSSHYSSSSQRRIMELEALLQEEKSKRVQLEHSLKKIIKNNLINS